MRIPEGLCVRDRRLRVSDRMGSLIKLRRQDKTVLRVTGAADALLKGYATNAADKPETAFVDLRGRVVAIALVRRLSAEECLLVVGRSYADRLRRHLDKYLPLLGAGIEPDTSYRVYLHLGQGATESSPDLLVIRHRGAETLLARTELPADATQAEYNLYRTGIGLAEQGEDFDDPLLLDVYDASHVCYAKGCFLGQEILARVHYRSGSPRRMIVAYRSRCSAETAARMTSVAVDQSTQEERGFVIVDRNEP